MPELISPLIRVADAVDSGQVSINFNSYVSDSVEPVISNIAPVSVSEEGGKKRGRPPKQKLMTDGTVMISAHQDQDLTMIQSNTPYISTFNETNALLRGTIMDIDGLNRLVKDQLDSVVESKTLRKKYDYVSELSSTSANLISTKIRTISEMNKVISDSHNLDIRRMKELKLNTMADDANSDKRMMDMYSAFINTPVGSYGMAGPQFPSMQEMTVAGGGVGGIDIGSAGQTIDPGYMNWKQNMSPETNRMILQKNNPNIQTVVVYDQTTNNKFFDVIDRATGQSVPNVPRPDSFLLADTYPNINNGTARNSNIDAVYPLMLTGAPSSLNDY